MMGRCIQISRSCCRYFRAADASRSATAPSSPQLFLSPLQARAERERAAKKGWYHNARGQMSFSDLAGVNIRVSAGGGGGDGGGGEPEAAAPSAAAAAGSR